MVSILSSDEPLIQYQRRQLRMIHRFLCMDCKTCTGTVIQSDLGFTILSWIQTDFRALS